MYIDAEKLKAEIERWSDGKLALSLLIEIKELITSLQQEQPEVELEKAIDKEWAKCEPVDEGMGLESASIVNEQFDSIARHFYELGLNARKEE